MTDENKDKGKLDYLSKYRASDDEVVTDAIHLSFAMVHPVSNDGHRYTHVSLPYNLLRRVEYDDGRWPPGWRHVPDAKPVAGQAEEQIVLCYLHGEVIRLRGCFLESIHRRILRQEIDIIREIRVSTLEEIASIREQAKGKPTVYAIHATLPLVDLADNEAGDGAD